MRGDRPFTYMASPGAKQQQDEARAYAVIMDQLQKCDDRRPAERPLYAMKEAVRATRRQMPSLKPRARQDLEQDRARRWLARQKRDQDPARKEGV